MVWLGGQGRGSKAQDSIHHHDQPPGISIPPILQLNHRTWPYQTPQRRHPKRRKPRSKITYHPAERNHAGPQHPASSVVGTKYSACISHTPMRAGRRQMSVARGDLASNILGAGNIYLSIHQPAPRWFGGRVREGVEGGLVTTNSHRCASGLLSGLGEFVGEAAKVPRYFTLSAFISAVSLQARASRPDGFVGDAGGRARVEGRERIFSTRRMRWLLGKRGRMAMGSCKVRHVRHTHTLSL